MALVTSLTVGRLRVHALEAGIQRLDGGAMFGVVPRPLWQKRIAPDERHRIPLAMRCLLVEHAEGPVLVDTGLGNKEDARFLDIYGVENAGHAGPTQLEDALAELGVRPTDIRWVVNTHLHFDHAGGNTTRDAGSDAVRLSFPNATYVVQGGELAFARAANERTRASYLPPNYEPVAAAGRFRLLNGDETILPGIRARVTPGHVPWHQSILLEDQGDTALFLGDVVPTVAHLPLAWIMGYDTEPMRTLESKRALLHDAVAGRWRFLFEHDATIVGGRVVAGAREVELADVLRRAP